MQNEIYCQEKLQKRGLKKLFNDNNLTKKEKLILMQLLPKIWSSHKIAEFSDTSRWLATKSKSLDNNEPLQLTIEGTRNDEVIL